MVKWNVGPPKKKGRYHIAYFDESSDKPIVSECFYDGESGHVCGNALEPDALPPNNSISINWFLDLHHIEAHKPYPTITKAWIKHLKETKRA